MSCASRIVRFLLAAAVSVCASSAGADPAELRRLAHDYYEWRDFTFR
jgi:hypothetical protein